MTKSFSVTATREPLSEDQQHAFFDLMLEQIRDGATEMHHGACEGGDAFAHFVMVQQVGMWVHLHPATGTGKWDASHRLQRTMRTVWHDPKTTAERNTDLAELGNVMIGAPRYPEKDERSKRSGTWQTLRKAKAAGKLCLVANYDGTTETWYDPNAAPSGHDSKVESE